MQPLVAPLNFVRNTCMSHNAPHVMLLVFNRFPSSARVYPTCPCHGGCLECVVMEVNVVLNPVNVLLVLRRALKLLCTYIMPTLRRLDRFMTS